VTTLGRDFLARHERKLTLEAIELATERTEFVDAVVLVERTENLWGSLDGIVIAECGGFRDVLELVDGCRGRERRKLC